MAEQGKFKRQITLSDLTFIGLGSMVGSGWLFASSHVASIAGPAGVISWIIGGIAILLLGLVFSELGAAIPRAGAIIRFPVFSHGPIIGYLMGFINLIAFSSLTSIEVEAGRQYAASWIPGLTQKGSTLPTLSGWMFQFILLLIFFGLNYWSVKVFAKANTVITLFKWIVPTITIIVLLTQFKPGNLSLNGFAPFGFSGIQGAISAGGIMFAYLGLTPIISVASETKNPQHTIPLALILSSVLSTIIYLLLQFSFIGSIPTHMLLSGWSGVSNEFSLPFKDIALTLGFGWLAMIIVLDAIISPSGAGNIYMSSTPRVVYAWAKSGTLFKIFTRIDKKSGVPRPALWLSLAFCVFWTLPFPSWEVLVNVVSAALILSYAIAPISAAAFRRNAPDLPRPFYLKGMAIIGPLSFIIASLIAYWSGWNTISWLLGSQILMFVIYLFFKKVVPTDKVGFAQQVKSSLWLIFYYAGIMVVSCFGTFGGSGLLSQPWDVVGITVISLISYYWGTCTCLPQAIFDDVSDESVEIDYKEIPVGK
ncbi:APC family permease [Sporolactobacillus sp. THM7-4]|nr:APC family permease [Sporolactobacillus sp. THM7-4]